MVTLVSVPSCFSLLLPLCVCVKGRGMALMTASQVPTKGFQKSTNMSFKKKTLQMDRIVISVWKPQVQNLGQLVYLKADGMNRKWTSPS